MSDISNRNKMSVFCGPTVASGDNPHGHEFAAAFHKDRTTGIAMVGAGGNHDTAAIIKTIASHGEFVEDGLHAFVAVIHAQSHRESQNVKFLASL